MGLDMTAYAIPAGASEGEEIHYWRKHHELLEWCESLAKERGQGAWDEPAQAIVLTSADLDKLANAVSNGFGGGSSAPTPPQEQERAAPTPGSALAQQAVAGIVKHADALPDAAARAQAYRVAASYSTPGSALERQTVEGIVKYAEALPDATTRVEAYRVAARHAASGSALEQQAVSKLRELSQPTRSESEIAAFVQRFGNRAPS